jgi:hypothetical protein
MTNTIAEATRMKAWSPDWYHWLRFSEARGLHVSMLLLRFVCYFAHGVAQDAGVAFGTCAKVVHGICTHQNHHQ